MIDRVFILLSMILCLLCSSSAQTAGSTDQETVKALVKEVSELKARIAVLEAKQSQAEAAPAPGPGKAVSAEVPPIPAQAPASEPGKFELVHGIKMQGLGAGTYKANDAKRNGFRRIGGIRFVGNCPKPPHRKSLARLKRSHRARRSFVPARMNL